MKINDETLYLCDNGACYCGAHLGTTAKMTGHDISGQKIEAVTPEMAAYAMRTMSVTIKCENPRCASNASLLVTR